MGGFATDMNRENPVTCLDLPMTQSPSCIILFGLISLFGH
jgi:hypothetical protein